TDLGDDARLTERGTPVHLADAHGVGDDERFLALARLRVVVEPVLGQIHHDALARPRWKNAPSRECQALARSRDPDVDAGIRTADLVVAEAVALCELGERVLVDRRHALVDPDQCRPILGQLEAAGQCGAAGGCETQNAERERYSAHGYLA